MKKILLLLLLLCFELAAEQLPTPNQDLSLSAGFGYFVKTQIYKVPENDSFPIPFISWKSDNFYIRGLNIGYYVYRKYPQANIVLQPTMLEIDNDEGTYNEDLGKRHRTINAGIEILFPTPWFLIGWLWHHDILGVHKGWMTSIEVKKRFYLSEKLSLNPTLGLYLYSKSYVDYYFGIDNDEVKSDRINYQPGASFSWGPSLTIGYTLNNQWSLLLLGKYLRYDGEVSNSPLVKRDDQFIFMMGITKKFD